MKIRCSALPRIWKCPASAQVAEAFNLQSDASQLGTDVHANLAGIVQGKAWTPGDNEDINILTAMGASMWRELKENIKDIVVESEFACSITEGETIVLTGHLDLWGRTSDGACFVDWKTGMVDGSDYWPQMRGYALQLIDKHPDIDRVTGIIGWVRTREIDVQVWTRAELLQWRDELIAKLGDTKGFNPGDACRYCPQQFDCTARNALVTVACKDLLEARPDGITTPEFLAAGYSKVQLLKQAIDRYDQAMKQAVRVAGEKGLAIGNGKKLVVEIRTKDSIMLTDDSNRLVKEALGKPIWDACPDAVTIGKEKLLDLIAKKAPKGDKGKAKDRFMAALKAVSSVKSVEYEALCTKKEG